MNFVVPDFYPAAAEIFVAVMALVTMLASAFARSIARSLAYYATQFTLIAAAFVTAVISNLARMHAVIEHAYAQEHRSRHEAV